MKKAEDWLETHLPGKVVDLIKINIEGGEYDLLEHLLSSGMVKRFKNIQVQFHEDVIPKAEARMRKIHDELSKTHRVTFQKIFIWENWEIKE